MKVKVKTHTPVEVEHNSAPPQHNVEHARCRHLCSRSCSCSFCSFCSAAGDASATGGGDRGEGEGDSEVGLENIEELSAAGTHGGGQRTEEEEEEEDKDGEHF